MSNVTSSGWSVVAHSHQLMVALHPSEKRLWRINVNLTNCDIQFQVCCTNSPAITMADERQNQEETITKDVRTRIPKWPAEQIDRCLKTPLYIVIAQTSFWQMPTNARKLTNYLKIKKTVFACAWTFSPICLVTGLGDNISWIFSKTSHHGTRSKIFKKPNSQNQPNSILVVTGYWDWQAVHLPHRRNTYAVNRDQLPETV